MKVFFLVNFKFKKRNLGSLCLFKTGPVDFLIPNGKCKPLSFVFCFLTFKFGSSISAQRSHANPIDIYNMCHFPTPTITACA